MNGRWLGIVLCAALSTQVILCRSEAATIAVVNQSSLAELPDDPFAATIRQGQFANELVLTGPIAERTAAGERLTGIVLEIAVAQADGTVLLREDTLVLNPGTRLEWRVLVKRPDKPSVGLDGALVSHVVLRDRELSTVEGTEREAREREREARLRAKADRRAALQRERKREEAVKARRWPSHVERAVIERKVIPGMTSEQVTMALGAPKRINETVRASGVSQQWIYSVYSQVYFENGRVTAIQSSR